MAEQHDQDEELMRAKLFASMKKKTPTVLEIKKPAAQPDAKPTTADKIFIKSFDQIMREKKAVDNGGSSDDQGVKEKGINRKRAIDLKNRQRELVLARKQAKVAATSQAPAAEPITTTTATTAVTRAKRAGQPLGIRSRIEKALTEAAASKPTISTSPVLAPAQNRSPTSQATPSPKSLQNETALSLNNEPPAATSSQASSSGGAKQPFEHHLEALRREIELANKIIDEFAQMDAPEFHDLNLDMMNDDDQKFIENMSSFLAGTVS